MESPKLIGLYAQAEGSGKTTVANYLAKTYGYTRVRFAGVIKSMIAQLLTMYGYDKQTVAAMIDGHLKEEVVPELGVTSRVLMQTLGTEWGRQSIHPDIWINATIAHIGQLLSDGYKVVVDDVRFPNEADALRTVGGSLFLVDRGITSLHTHASEGGMRGYRPDAVIDNTRDLASLYNETDRVLAGKAQETISDQEHPVTPEVSEFLMGLVNQMIADRTNRGTLYLETSDATNIEMEFRVSVVPQKVH